MTSEVYSGTAAELFWSRAFAPPPRYGVTRDGVELGTTDGTSFFDDTIPGPGDYAYEVFGIYPNGARSVPSAVRVAVGGAAPTPGPDATPISADNAVRLLRAAFEVYSGRRFGADILSLPRYPAESLDYDPPRSDRDGTVTVSDACDNGGTVTLAETVTGAPADPHPRLRLRQLPAGRDRVRGRLRPARLRQHRDRIDGAVPVRVPPDDDLLRSAVLHQQVEPGRRTHARLRHDGGGLTDGATEGASLSDATFGYRYVLGGFRFGIEGGYRVDAPFTGGRALVASTPEPLAFELSEDPIFQADGTRPESVRFATGTLRIADSDGNSLTLAADNGDPLSANVEVAANGSVTSFVEPWSSFADALDFAFDLR